MLEAEIRDDLIIGEKSYAEVTDAVCSPMIEGKPRKAWYLLLGISSVVMLIGFILIGYTVYMGIGTWGLNKTIGWGFAITNFVWWVGIGHAGTLISAILLLFRQRWRQSIARAAEAMTIFAVMCAGLFPLLHMGRPWVLWWPFPVPNTRGPLWDNFHSPLVWDPFAIGTYFTVSLVFWYVGLVPDLASIRDRAKKKIAKAIYGTLALGWNGSTKTWMRYEMVALALAGLATPLVLSVHTIVSFDFATAVIPGWHTTIFPPYFVAGAIFSGFAMVLTLMIITRSVMNLKDYITDSHIDAMAQIVLLTGSLVGLAYGTEFFIAWYSGNMYEQFTFINRATGPYAWAYWSMISCNVISPQFFWFKKLRKNIPLVFVLSIVVNIGMWFERFVIITTSLANDYLPSSWAYYTGTWVEAGIYVGTIGLFFTLYLLFARFLPVIAFHEVKMIMGIKKYNLKDKNE